MPERYPTKNPQIIAGTLLYSGQPNTGQVANTYGGSHVYSKSSGVVGPDVLIWAGGGRLDGVYLIPSADLALSGKSVIFYDSAVVASGGPIALSGHRVLGGVSMPPVPTPSSGVPNVGGLVSVGFTFTSGLCHTTASGQFGFSASFSPTISG